ncbi:MAG: type III-A CRISPR-associated RAMP protein Csm5 [Chitinophagales bacterium]|nr:type III-A CRISPR-associated RAMP protein Csm5 [Chitinophagales bacterium]
MMKIKITTLTPVHVGSGREIQGGFEYVALPQEKLVAVLDPEKVLNLIGEEHLDLWVSCIEKGENILQKIPQLRNRSSAELAARTIPSRKPVEKPIREQIRSGNGQALLPGSSLKGALRTTVWAETLLDNKQLVKDRYKLGRDDRGKMRWSDSSLQKQLFGSDPNHDIFRLLQVGDAYFNNTAVFQTQLVNLKGKNWRIDRGEGKGTSPDTLIEAIPAGQSAFYEMRFNDLLLERAKGTDTFKQYTERLSIPELFKLVNAYTERLVSDESDYWANEDLPNGFEPYPDELDRIIGLLGSCEANECILRLGWGSGFRSMTGDWHGAMNERDYDDLIRSLRPPKYDGLLYPKTTRFVEEGLPLGFVKLTIV